MLRTNLSTRPYYNERAVHLGLAAVALLVLALTAFNLWEIYTLSGRDARVRDAIEKNETRARDLRSQAAHIRAALNPREIDEIGSAAREANLIIDRRVFSWTELFNRFERTLPESVYIASVRPKVERDGSMMVLMVVVGRDVGGINTFIENLEKDGGFEHLLSREEFVDEDGLLKATLEGRYLGHPARRAGRSTTP